MQLQKLREEFVIFYFGRILKSIIFSICWVCFPNIVAELKAQTAIGGPMPDPSAMLDVQGSTGGLLFPRLTSSARNAITAPANGLMIFNTSTGCLEINLGVGGTKNWESLSCTPGLIGSIDCAGAVQAGMLISGTAASGVSVSISYTDGNGYAHSGQAVSSTGVTGLTATLSTANFNTGTGSLIYAISGTPGAAGLANFTLDIGGGTCTLSLNVQ